MFKLFKKIFAADATPASLPPYIDTEVAKSAQVRGNALLAEGRLDAAVACYRQVVAACPDQVEGYVSLGYALKELQLFNEAASVLQRAISIKPNNVDAVYMLANVSCELGKTDTAIAHFNQAIKLDPNFELASAGLCDVLVACEYQEQAIAAILDHLSQYPQVAKFHYLLGDLYIKRNSFIQAETSLRKAISLRPDFADIHFLMAVALHKQGFLVPALESYTSAVFLKPDYPEAHNNKGTVLLALNRQEEALVCYDEALRLDPEYVDALVNRGAILQHFKRFAEALASCERAAKIRPDSADAHFNESICRLQLGDFERGWQQHEWRWRTSQLKDKKRVFSQPLWLGKESLQGKTIMLHAEQGLGDTIQFCRYAKLVAECGATVILLVPAALKSLLGKLEGVSVLITSLDASPKFDYHCPLLSLPLAFNTTIDTIVATVPYIDIEPEHVRKWQTTLGMTQKLRIGLVWSGNPAHFNDRNRSMALSSMLKLASEQAHFISLQKDTTPADRTLLDDNNVVTQFKTELQDFTDTAALIENVDLVISVDTSVAHLAGALGKPVWILLPFHSDWRWLVDRSDSPWYPTAKLYRQANTGDWETVLKAVSDDLSAYVSHLSKIRATLASQM